MAQTYDYEPKKVAQWNMDDAILKTILALKQLFLMKKENWDLDGAYWVLRNIWSESECAFEEPERKECLKKLKELEEKRKTYLKDKQTYKSMFHHHLEDFSVLLNRYMVENKYYFRKDYEEEEGL